MEFVKVCNYSRTFFRYYRIDLVLSLIHILKGMTVTADSQGHVKGYPVVADVMLPPNKQHKLDVGGAVGVGMMRVIKDMGLKEPYVGTTVLQTSEIAEDLTYYFATSEQVPSSVGPVSYTHLI